MDMNNINNDNFGGFMVSKNVFLGHPVGFSFREPSSIPQLNGWNILSVSDDQEYVDNPDNFMIVTASSLFPKVPVLFELFDAPYGTDLQWIYEQNVHVGFYDLVGEKEVTIEEIMK